MNNTYKLNCHVHNIEFERGPTAGNGASAIRLVVRYTRPDDVTCCQIIEVDDEDYLIASIHALLERVEHDVQKNGGAA